MPANPSRATASDDDYVEFVQGRSAGLLRAAYLLTGDQGLAEDLVQTALARTHLAWHRLSHHGNAEAYTRQVMYHLQVDGWRRKRVAEVLPGRLPEPHTADVTEAIDTKIAVQRALRHLTPKQRAVVTLRYFEDHSEADAAAVLGCSIGTIKSQNAKALGKLRAICPELDPRVYGADVGRLATDEGAPR
jgi:RNA polymerase sigma-70 factor (sigma-E family)